MIGVSICPFVGYWWSVTSNCNTTVGPGIEVVVVDDCSTDDSIAVVTAFSQRCRSNCVVKIVVRTENGGVAAALNTGTLFETVPSTSRISCEKQ